MKKYIAPEAKFMTIAAESSLFSGSIQVHSAYGDENYFSNKREDDKPAGSSIWDN